MSISDIAALKNLTRQSISERVSRLEAQGLLSTRPGKGKQKLVNLAEYDRAIGATGDAIRAMNAGVVAAPPFPRGHENGDPVLAREQARRVSYQAELSRLDLDERLKKLLPVEGVVSAISTCAEGIIRAIEQLPTRADELAAAVGKDGAQGARVALKAIARDVRVAIDREMRKLADEGLVAQGDAEKDAAT